MPGRRVYGKGDKMSLRIVALNQFPLRIRAGGVEIAQHGDAQTFRGARIGENLLAGELGASVGIDRALRRALRNG